MSKPIEHPQPIDRERLQEIATLLGETGRAATHIRRIAYATGMEFIEATLRATLEIEAAGGTFTERGDRRRTPGGTFFKIAKDTIPSDMVQAAFPTPYNPKRHLTTKVTAAAIPGILNAASQIPVEKRGIAMLKAQVTGRPKQFKVMDTFTILIFTTDPAPWTPKTLPPPPPQQEQGTIVVFATANQWKQIEPTLKVNPEETVYVEGHIINDAKRNMTAVWAETCIPASQKSRQQKHPG